MMVGPMIAPGFIEPMAARREIMVVGRIVRLEAVIATKVHIAAVACSGSGFNVCNSDMAFIPNGVQALPNPSKFALILMAIAASAGCSLGMLGNSQRITGPISLAKAWFISVSVDQND